MKERIGLFGGTFNPIHNCHISMAESFVKELTLDLLIVIPSGYSYHKEDNNKDIANFHRYNMCELAFKNYPNIEVSDIDIQKTGNTYTYNTVVSIQNMYPKSDLWWLLGSDSFLNLDHWYRYTDLIPMISFAIALRVPDSRQDITNKNKCFNPSATIKILTFPECSISSTQIRAGIKNNLIKPEWLPIEVKQYLEQNKLYTRN